MSEDIIRMARKANIAKYGLGWTCWKGQLEHFAFLVASAERRKCAELCDRFANRKMSAKQCADAIRSRTGIGE